MLETVEGVAGGARRGTRRWAEVKKAERRKPGFNGPTSLPLFQPAVEEARNATLASERDAKSGGYISAFTEEINDDKVLLCTLAAIAVAGATHVQGRRQREGNEIAFDVTAAIPGATCSRHQRPHAQGSSRGHQAEDRVRSRR